jgi:hypothetical protein
MLRNEMCNKDLAGGLSSVCRSIERQHDRRDDTPCNSYEDHRDRGDDNKVAFVTKLLSCLV